MTGVAARQACHDEEMSGLTRESRYEPAGLTATRWTEGPVISYPNPVEVLRCRSCSSLLLTGDEDIHERLHPSPDCMTVHPTMAIACRQPHAWEDQFR